MKRKTHLVLGVGASLLILNPTPPKATIVILFSAAASLIPDLDLHIKHRKAMHNVFVMTLYSISMYYIIIYAAGLLGFDAHIYAEYSLASSILGYSLHLICDSLTYRGVGFLWPLSRKMYGVKSVSFESRFWNAFITFIGTLMIVYWLAYTSGFIEILRYFILK